MAVAGESKRAASERGRGDASDMDGQNREVECAGAHESISRLRSSEFRRDPFYLPYSRSLYDAATAALVLQAARH